MSTDNLPPTNVQPDEFGAVTITPEQAESARRTIAGRARDAADARFLMAALGITS